MKTLIGPKSIEALIESNITKLVYVSFFKSNEFLVIFKKLDFAESDL